MIYINECFWITCRFFAYINWHFYRFNAPKQSLIHKWITHVDQRLQFGVCAAIEWLTSWSLSNGHKNTVDINRHRRHTNRAWAEIDAIYSCLETGTRHSTEFVSVLSIHNATVSNWRLALIYTTMLIATKKYHTLAISSRPILADVSVTMDCKLGCYQIKTLISWML